MGVFGGAQSYSVAARHAHPGRYQPARGTWALPRASLRLKGRIYWQRFHADDMQTFRLQTLIQVTAERAPFEPTQAVYRYLARNGGSNTLDPCWVATERCDRSNPAE